MGRCNNRRTQQAAQELRNTPSRARFSSGPPNKRKGRGGRGGRGGGRGGNNNDTANKNGRGGGAAKAAVVEKLSKRVEQKSTPTASLTKITKRRHPLANVDISKLDELVLPEESLQEVMKLLSDLNVKVVESVVVGTTRKKDVQTTNNDDETTTQNESLLDPTAEEYTFNDNDDNEIDSWNPDTGATKQQRQTGQASSQRNTGGYSEYEDDGAEEEEDLPTDGYTPNMPDVDESYWDNDDDDDEEGEMMEEESQQPLSQAEQRAQAKAKFVLDPVFIHLSSRLSFSEDTALRACQAIADMVADDLDDDHKNNNDKPSAADSKLGLESQTERKRQGAKMALAMDWLCLHLAEEELTQGFKTNPKMTSPIILMGTGRTKPIPHPSISVAKKITTDRDWKKDILTQEKVMKFLPLGFLHGEAYDAFKDYKLEQLEGESSSTKKALDDDGALRMLLSCLEKDTLDTGGTEKKDKNEQHPKADLDYAASEREEEEQALAAIYDDQFQLMDKEKRDSPGQYRYTIAITPSEPLREPARSENCTLHVFVRPGYPAFETPLLLFHNPTLPPSLLRRINVELIRHVEQGLGAPAIFEAVNYLTSELAALQQDFMKEQRSKEMEAEQLRLRREAGHVVDEDDDETGTEGTLGRRQRAKLKAAAKAYDQPEQAKQKELERQQLQDSRMERVKVEDKNIRQSMAERAIEKREKERQEKEIEAVHRSALSDSLRNGDPVEKAREVASKAKKDYLIENGLLKEEAKPESRGDKDTSATSAGGQTDDNGDFDGEEKKENIPTSTPTTAAFMERLREMYAAAAKDKAEGKDPKARSSKGKKNPEHDLDAYHLNPPKLLDTEEATEALDEGVRFPRPVAVPVGELARVMEDVIATQKEQPWLVASEARVPETLGNGLDGNKSSQKCRDISRKLKEENQRKYKAVIDLRKENSSKANNASGKNQKGFTPQRFDKMLSQRERLPAYLMKDKIISTISTNQITVVAGDTGCGKTTQVPQLVLDELINNNHGAEANIIVTQPRRISAIGVSERIADERCERVGETCGYSIMLERKSSRKTRLLLCTTGILLRRLQCDPDLASVSHVFVDEVHERDLNTDFLLIILRELLNRRKSLKLVLMSATLNADAFSEYFGGCAIISIPGRAHPVKEYRLEDVLQLTEYEVQEGSDFALKDNAPRKFSKSALRKMYYPKYDTKVIHSLSIVKEDVINYELLAALLEKISQNEDDGAILVFMPGMMEITKAIDEMHKKEFFQSPAVRIHPLHSSLSTSEQTAVFDIPEAGVRKIVVATNIAETSITIEDVVYVVDCGRVKENRKDEINETPTLVECWVSRASAKQRRGRAGRVRPGIAYHLYSSHTFEHELQDYQLPEMLRVGLEDLVLQILILDLGEPSSFLGRALNPPSELSMRNSLKLLEELGAVECDWKDDDGAFKLEEPKALEPINEEDPQTTSCRDMQVASELTALGFHLATLPVDPRVGKMMIYGSLFGCIDPALTIAASMSARNPFVSPFDKRDEADAARKKFAMDGSDHLAILQAFTEWKEIRRTKGDKAAQHFMRDNFLSRQTLFQLEDLRKQFSNLLVSIGFLPSNFRLADSRGRNNGNTNGNGNTTFSSDDMNGSTANTNADNMALVKSVLCAGLYPNIIVAPRPLVSTSASSGGDKQAGEVAFQSLNKGDVYLHPCTIAFREKKLESRYCCYHDMVKTSKTYVRDCTTVSPFALVLFGGTLVVHQEKGVVTVDEWLKFRIGRRPATLVKHLRAQMESMLLRKIVSPEDDVTGSPIGQALIQSISTLLRREKADKQVRNDGAEIVRPWRQGGDDDEQRNNNGRGGGRGGRGRGRGRGGGRGRGRGSRGGR